MYTSEEKKRYMQLAFAEAEKARVQDEVPIGAIVVGPDGTVIGKGYNRRELDEDGTAHAEMLAIRQACQAPEAAVEFLVGGTQANATVIAAILRP